MEQSQQTQVCCDCPEKGAQPLDNFYMIHTSRNGITHHYRSSRCKRCQYARNVAAVGGPAMYAARMRKYKEQVKLRRLRSEQRMRGVKLIPAETFHAGS
jgi:hypothetical protein